MSRLTPLTASAAAIATLAAAAPATGAPWTLAEELQPFYVAASQGVVAWSSWDSRDRIYRLVTLHDGQRTVLPVPGGGARRARRAATRSR